MFTALAVIAGGGTVAACGHTNHAAQCPRGAPALRAQDWTTDAPITAIAVHCSTVFVGGSFGLIGPSTGAAALVDPVSGRRRPFPRFDGTVTAVAADGRGGWFVGGSFDDVDGQACHALVHVQGRTVDWCPLRSGSVQALAVDGHSIYVVATSGQSMYTCCVRLMAFDPRKRGAPRWRLKIGRREICWASGNCGDAAFVNALVASDGTVYVGGFFASVGGTHIRDLAAVDGPTGRVLAWDAQVSNTRKLFPTQTVVGTLALAGRTLYVGGAFTRIGGAERSGLAALRTGTAQATDWYPRLRLQVSSLESAQPWVSVFASPARVFLTGQITAVDGRRVHGIAAIDPTSARMLPWHTPAAAKDNGPGTVAVVPSALAGRSLYVTASPIVDGETAFVASLDVVSGRVTRWRPRPNSAVSAVAVGRSGVVIGGSFSSVNAVARDGLAAIDGRRARLLAWRPGLGPHDAESLRPSVNSMLATDRTLYVGGAFTALGGRRRRGLAAFDLPSLDLNAWHPRLDKADHVTSPYALALVGDTLYVAGDFAALNGHPRDGFGAVSADSGDVVGGDSFTRDPYGGGNIYTLYATQDSVFAGGQFTTMGPGVAAFDAKSGAVARWSAGLPLGDHHYRVVRTFAVAGGSLYVGGSDARLDATDTVVGAFAPLVRLDLKSGRLLPFQPRITGAPPWDLSIDTAVTAPAGLYIAGTFTAVGGKRRNGIALLDPRSGRAKPWTLPSCERPAPVDTETPGGRVLAVKGSRILTSCRAFGDGERLVVAPGASTRSRDR